MTSEMFDFSDYDVDFEDAGGEDRSQPFTPPTGPATVRIVSVKMKAAKDGTPTLNWGLSVMDGEHKGKMIWRKNRITRGDAKCINRLNSDLLTAGVKLTALEELNDQSKLDTLRGTVLAVSVKVTDAAKNFYDVYINRRLKAEDISSEDASF